MTTPPRQRVPWLGRLFRAVRGWFAQPAVWTSWSGGQPTHGLVWQSRQTELHARVLDARPALRDLVALHPAKVAVLWWPPAPGPLLIERDGGLGPLDSGEGYRYVSNLTAELGIVLM